MPPPPVVPNVNGLLYFLKEASTHFSAEEQSAIADSAAGQRLKHSYDQCLGHSQQLHQARRQFKRQIQQKRPISEGLNGSRKEEMNELKRQVQIQEMKYINCLTYMTCPTEWKCYHQCWAERANSIDMTKHHKNSGTLDWICRSERVAIERCVGSTVANAILAGDLSSS
jgi:hypothetical protein